MRQEDGGCDHATKVRDQTVDTLFEKTTAAMEELQAALAELRAKVMDHA